MWHWRAHYSEDGSSYLDEYDADGTQHGFAEVDIARVVVFELRPVSPGLPPVLVKIGRQSRPIFWRTHITSVNPQTGEQVGQMTITVAGWQRTVNGRNVQSLTACYPNGAILCVDDRSKIEGI